MATLTKESKTTFFTNALTNKKFLNSRRLIASEQKGRSFTLRTTKKFLEYFGKPFADAKPLGKQAFGKPEEMGKKQGQ